MSAMHHQKSGCFEFKIKQWNACKMENVLIFVKFRIMRGTRSNILLLIKYYFKYGWIWENKNSQKSALYKLYWSSVKFYSLVEEFSCGTENFTYNKYACIIYLSFKKCSINEQQTNIKLVWSNYWLICIIFNSLPYL